MVWKRNACNAGTPDDAGAVLVTGASSGIGRTCVLRLARAGFRVFAGVLRVEDGLTLQKDAGGVVDSVRLDVTEPDDIHTATALLSDKLGSAGLFGLVNNAGIAVAGPMETVRLDDLRRQLEVNVLGHVAVTQSVLELLYRAKGRVINMSSISGRIALPFFGSYAASKHALEALSDSWRVELAPAGVRVVVVEPGCVDTPAWAKSLTAAAHDRRDWSESARLRYDAPATAMRALTMRTLAHGISAERVSQVVLRAITAARPKARYVVGPDAVLGLWMKRVLSDRLRDALVRAAMALVRNPAGAEEFESEKGDTN